MLKYLSPSAVAKIVLITLKSIYCELTHIVLRFVFRFEKVTCAKVPALHISSWGYSGLLNRSLVQPCKNIIHSLLPIFKKRAVCVFEGKVHCFFSKSTFFIKCSYMWTKGLYKCFCCFRVFNCCYVQKLNSKHWQQYETIAITNEIICVETSWSIKTKTITGHDWRSANARHCVAFQRNIMSSYFYRSLFVWSHNARVQLRSEQPITKNFVSQNVVVKSSKHFMTVDDL